MVLYFLGQFRVGAVYTVGIGKRGTFFFYFVFLPCGIWKKV